MHRIVRLVARRAVIRSRSATGAGPRPVRKYPPERHLRAQTCTRWTAARLRPAGARCGAHEIASTLTGRRAAAVLPRGGLPGLLSQFLSHSPRPGLFTDVHPDRVRAVRGRWRTVVNAGQHRWKACWGQPLASSNLASSATLTRENTDRRCQQAAASRPAGLICWSQFERPASLTPGFAATVLPGHGWDGRP